MKNYLLFILVMFKMLRHFLMCREAMRRGTSVFLPTATYPMFPEKLAMEGMSLKQGEVCNAVTVSVILHSDGW
jgi:exoribonuclease R